MIERNNNWNTLSWQEKREERFKRWLSPADFKFENEQAEKLYKERVTRFIKAIKMEEPDRVPVMLPTGNFPAYWAGADYRTIMYDHVTTRRIWLQYLEAFGDMDTFGGPSFVPSGRISEALDLKTQKLPGLGLPENSPMHQFVEAEYMKADEYELYFADPTDYMLRINTPRSAGLFESFAKLPPLRLMYPAGWVSVLADPDIRRTFQTLMDLADEYRRYERETESLNNYIKSRGYPSLSNIGPLQMPFDYFADGMRGTRGIVMDMYRQPGKLLEYLDRWLELNIGTIKNYPMTETPICMMPLHKGDDTFMSDKQFETFYWPGLRKVFMAMIEEGLVPMPFAEGRYNNRLKQIADTPKSAVAWWFDQTDMAQAKKILGNTSCIMGNVPTSVVRNGAAAQVKERCRRLIEDCAPGGGFILSGGASIDNGKIENLQAMMEAAREYGVYGK